MTATTTTGLESPLAQLHAYGQSVWLDYIRRSLVTSGELERLIDEDGLRGVTSNPSIFEKAITGSTDYQDLLDSPANRGMAAKNLYEMIAVRDVQSAADLLRGVYEESQRRDGYVSLEVSPLLARDTEGTLAEARRLWQTVDRENLMVKVPGTLEAFPAIRQLISEGINVNVTLLFSRSAYQRVAEAYIAGLEDRLALGKSISGVASVASFFISRIDSAVDALIAEKLQSARPDEQALMRSVRGKVAISNAKLAYALFRECFSGPRWEKLLRAGAQQQRLLWASTSSKNPAYRDVIYIEEFIGPDTVNTIPPQTFAAFREHGRLRESLTEDIETAWDVMETLARAGISMEDVASNLLTDGLQQFEDAFSRLLDATGKRAGGPESVKVNRLTYALPPAVQAAVEASLAEWSKDDKVSRLWRRDASLWTGADEGAWLAWLDITDDRLAHIEDLKSFSEAVRTSGFEHVLLLGMGGSSLCPEVLRMTFGKIPGYPELHVLDSTDPAQIQAMEARIDLARTLFVVSSKSGGTLEPNIFKQYFFERVTQLVGEKEAGNRFVAITDPGSKMQHVAEHDRFRHIFFGVPGIGGRYSALSNFGMAPAAAMGVDLAELLSRTEEMVHACGPTVPTSENPAVVLGTILGVLAGQGCDKVTIFTSPGISDLGAWLEQLLAESTGKVGKGLIPVDRESIGPPAAYGRDRVFVYLRLETDADPKQDAAIKALEETGHPVVRIVLENALSLGEEFFRWEVATAVAGSIMGIHAFNQPDVEASKLATRRLTSEYEQNGSLAPETPLFESKSVLEPRVVRLYADPANTKGLNAALRADPSVVAYLRAHLGRLTEGDYFAVLAYIAMNEEHERLLQVIRHAVRDSRRVATCLGFGPRFLHSTGQAYEGGPNTGVFLQITCEDEADLAIPGQKYTFGVVKAAQARGDFQVLADRGRRALRVHLGANVTAGLERLASAVQQALA
jgi:transaldolase/glucose-6-phosphate isomerase